VVGAYVVGVRVVGALVVGAIVVGAFVVGAWVVGANVGATVVGAAVGASVVKEDVQAIWKGKKRALIVGFISQYGFMPLMAFLCAKLWDMPDLRAVGLVLVGISPSGSTSNVCTVWSDGNVALSVAMSALSNIWAFATIPILFELYVRRGLGMSSDDFAVPYGNLCIALLTMVIPICLGALIRRRNTTTKFRNKFLHEWLVIVGGLSCFFFLAVMLSKGRSGAKKTSNPADYPDEWTIAALFQPLGCLFGFALSCLLGVDFKDGRAIALESGIQNITISYALADLIFSGCAHEEVSLFLHLAFLWYVINSLLIVLFIRLVLSLSRGRGLSSTCTLDRA